MGEELLFLPHSEQDVRGSQAGKDHFSPNHQPASVIRKVWAGGPGINVYLEVADLGLWMSTSGCPPWQQGYQAVPAAGTFQRYSMSLGFPRSFLRADLVFQ